MKFPTVSVAELLNSGEAEVKTGPFGTQLKASDYVSEGTPVINVRNIGFGNIREDKLEYIGKETVQRLASHLLRPKDIVFGRKGAVERHVFIQPGQSNWFQGSDCLRLRLSSGRIIPRFASYYLLTHEHQQWMMGQCSHGATMASLNQDIISRIQLPCPPLATQRRIASILSAYDDLIENNTRRIAILEEMARRIYEEWFVRFRFPGHEQVKRVESELGLIPEGWSWGCLRDVAEDVRESVNPDAVAPDTPYVGLEHISRRSIALAEWGFASEVQSTKLRFVRGDILFGKIRPYFHKVAVAPVDGVASSDAIVIRAREPKWYPMVLATVSSDAFVAEATQSANGTKMPRANWNVLLGYKVPKPTDEVLAKFNEIMLGVVDFVRIATLKNRNLRATRDLLLPSLISGDLDISALSDIEVMTA